MLRRIKPKSLYYGWVVVAAAGGMEFANAASSIGLLSIFVVPMGDEFGWSRTQIAGATSVGAVLGAILAPFTGRLVDRYGSRLVLVISGGIVGLACVYLYLVQSLLGFYLAFTASRIADQGGIKIGASVIGGKWFLRYRGRATSLVFFAGTAGTIVLAPLTQLVITAWGWREAWLMLAGVMLLVGVLPCARMVRRQPEDMGLLVDGGPEEINGPGPMSGGPGSTGRDPSMGLREVSRTPMFWTILASLFMVSAATSGAQLHLISYLTGEGINSGSAVGAISLMSACGAGGALLLGTLSDRFSPRWMMASLYLMGTASLGVLIITDSLVEMYSYSVLAGISASGVNTLTPIMWSSYYGREALASIYGVSRAAQVMGFALGPLVSGIFFDVTGSYKGAFFALAWVALAACLLVAAARSPAGSRPIEREG